MKKYMLLPLLCLWLLSSCAAPAPDPSLPTEEPVSNESAVITCRIVTDVGGSLLLASAGGTSRDIYLQSADDAVWLLNGEPFDPSAPGAFAALPWETLCGALVDITFGGDIMESYPAQLGGVVSINIRTYGFDDRCVLYLQVLEDLWNEDAGLNHGVEEIGVDLSQTSLSPAEQAAVALAFAGNHDAALVEGTMESLQEQGYITGEPLDTADIPSDTLFWQWKNGCFYSITETPTEGTYSLTPVTFDAMKWRSSLGAYWFSDCTAVQAALGLWSDYSVGTHMIS